MSNKYKDFSPNELAKRFEFFKKLELYTFYEEIENLYNSEKEGDVCNKATEHSGIEDPDVLAFLKNICGSLNLLLNSKKSPIYNIKSKDKHCIYFKYWLFDKFIVRGFDEHDINIIFDFLEKHKNGYMKLTSSDISCNYYRLTLQDIYDIKNIYDYSEILYNANIDNYDEISEDTEYLNYFKKGIYLYKSSKTRCYSDMINKYCNEFREYEKIHSKHKKELLSLSYETPKDILDPVLHKLLNEIVEKKYLSKFYESLKEYSGTYTPNTCDSLEDYPTKGKGAICKLFGHVENIFKKWDDLTRTYEKLSVKETCDYLNYWLYGELGHLDATTCDIENFYFLWYKYSIDESRNIYKNKCYNEKYYGFNTEELRNKKKVFDFLVYYDTIKSKWKELKNDRKKEYCHYIKEIFELYKLMELKNDSRSYTEELKFFRNKFSSNTELHFLEENCSDMCLGFVFNNKHKTLCPFEENSAELVKAKLKKCEHLESSKVPGNVNKNNEDVYNFSGLPTATVYNELNGNMSTNTYYTICSELIPYDENHCGIYKLCNKLVRNLIKLYKMKHNGRIDRCEYIIHWLYHEVGKIPNVYSEDIYETVAVRVFFNVGYKILRKLGISDCFFNIFNINVDEQKEKKFLHDYFKNYEKMNGDNFCNNDKCKEYCEYISFINKLYQKYINSSCYCFTNDGCKEIYPYYFNCNDNYNPLKLFEKLQCNKFQEYHEKLEKVNTPVPEDHYVKMIAEISLKEPHLLNWGNKKTSIIPEVVYNKITSDPFYTFALGSFGFLGVFLILFILYKFTPMGSYFNNRDARNKESYFENFEKQFLEDEVPFKHGNTQNRRMRIAYHQA
ncbi:PIR Superfamily Protein [Plasmodium ovale curtisi]|uniref:PIR Superfamily Protein n=1 Tax=Plasmodium ovale curtisi TaxID=864141 RepID=A0A1A8XAR1_PLAOA|nr:PIR Superfamily Protein [Plasmodium ovale curtisi]